MRVLFVQIILLQFIFTQTFSDLSFIGSRSLGIVGANISTPRAIESAYYNPAGIINLSKVSFYSGTTRLYELSLLEHQFATIGFPNRDGTNPILLSYQKLSTSYNDEWDNNSYSGILSREINISLSQGIKLLDDKNSIFSIGYNLNYYKSYQAKSAGLSGDGSDGKPPDESTTFGLDVGLFASLRDKIYFGAFIKNINTPRIGKGSSISFLPRKINIGIGYKPITELSTNIALERIFGTKESSFRFGIEYLVTNNFELRTGMQMNPNRFGIGFSVKIKIVEISYGLLTHPILDNTNTLDIKVSFERF